MTLLKLLHIIFAKICHQHNPIQSVSVTEAKTHILKTVRHGIEFADLSFFFVPLNHLHIKQPSAISQNITSFGSCHLLQAQEIIMYDGNVMWALSTEHWANESKSKIKSASQTVYVIYSDYKIFNSMEIENSCCSCVLFLRGNSMRARFCFVSFQIISSRSKGNGMTSFGKGILLTKRWKNFNMHILIPQTNKLFNDSNII